MRCIQRAIASRLWSACGAPTACSPTGRPWGLGEGQVHGGKAEQRPHAAEQRIARALVKEGRLARGAGRQDDIVAVEPLQGPAARGAGARQTLLVILGADGRPRIEYGQQASAQLRPAAGALESQRLGSLEGHDVGVQLHQAAIFRRQRHFLDLRAGARQQPGRLFVGIARLGQGMAPLEGAQHAHARPLGILQLAQTRIAHQDRRQQRHVVDAARQAAYRVQVLAQGLHAGARHTPERRLVADDAAIGGGTDERSSRLGADSQRHHIVGHGGGRSTRRAARRIGRIARIARGPGLVGREFGGDRLAQHERARLAAQGHDRGVRIRLMRAVETRAIARGKVLRVKDIFDAKRQAMQDALHTGAVQRPRLRDHLRGIEGGPGLHGRLPLFDARQAGARHLLRREFTALQTLDGLQRAKLIQGFRHPHIPISIVRLVCGS